MPQFRPRPISATELTARQRRVSQVARRFGFVGRVEYRHVYSQTGGAQYGLAVKPEQDLLTVSAEAFERDGDADDFSLEAIIAHERGHQLLARHERLARNLPASWSGVTEEIVASLLGSLLVETEKDQQDLLLKALFEAHRQGMKPDRATLLITELRALLEKIL
jgi:hypothetical protein